TDGKKSTDGSIGDTGVVSDTWIPPPPNTVWCGSTGDAGDAGNACQGTCCVKIGNGYSFACKSKGDPCTGYNYAFSCDRSSDCPQSQYCCFTEMGTAEAGTYFAESHCGSCQQMDSMCLL